MTTALFDELLQIAPLPEAELPIEVERSVDALVRVLLADGLAARRSGLDRLEVSWSGRGAMEWCYLGDLVLGRALDGVDPTAWTHRHVPARNTAIADTGRAIGRSVRTLGGHPTA